MKDAKTSTINAPATKQYRRLRKGKDKKQTAADDATAFRK